MKIKRAILEAESAEKVPQIIKSITDFAEQNSIQGIAVHHIAGNTLTLHAPEEYFERLKETEGLKRSQDSQRTRLIAPVDKRKLQP